MNNQQHIENNLTLLRTILEETSAKIEALKPGERIPATQLAQTIAARHEINNVELYTMLKIFLFKGYPGIRINRGCKGGIEKLSVATTIVEKPNEEIK